MAGRHEDGTSGNVAMTTAPAAMALQIDLRNISNTIFTQNTMQNDNNSKQTNKQNLIHKYLIIIHS